LNAPYKIDRLMWMRLWMMICYSLECIFSIVLIWLYKPGGLDLKKRPKVGVTRVWQILEVYPDFADFKAKPGFGRFSLYSPSYNYMRNLVQKSITNIIPILIPSYYPLSGGGRL
jgi:hypothetical protein